ncbi:helix-turn-helix transcriptional regulator [Corallococcus macrosporus]|nr:LuxR C-terminal-related transcriptional regulator [Corallococcus macrosporus]
MCRLLGADAGACVLEGDFRPEGRGGFKAVVLEGWDGAARPALEALQRMGSACNPSIRSLMELTPVPGAVLTALRRELVGDRAWYGAPYVEHYLRPTHLDESMYSIRWSEVPGAVRGIGIYRGRNERPFDEADRELLHLFHAECGALLGLPEEPPGVRLTPRERQTLGLLLQGLGDKQIAARLGISRFTVNQYTKTLYRRFGVQSRTALLAKVLGGQGGGTRRRERLPAAPPS